MAMWPTGALLLTKLAKVQAGDTVQLQQLRMKATRLQRMLLQAEPLPPDVRARPIGFGKDNTACSHAARLVATWQTGALWLTVYARVAAGDTARRSCWELLPSQLQLRWQFRQQRRQ